MENLKVTEKHNISFSEVAVAEATYKLKLVPPSQIENVVCEPFLIEDYNEEHIDLTKRMFRFLAELGTYSLAAPQIGIQKKFFVYWKRNDDPAVIYNPQYYGIASSSSWEEKCLSYGRASFLVKRFKAIHATWYVPENGALVMQNENLSGRDSLIFQHETDHVGIRNNPGTTIAIVSKDYR